MPRIEVDWTPSGDGAADEFNVYQREAGYPTWTPVGSTRGSSMQFDVSKAGVLLEVAIAPVVQGIEAHVEDWTVIDFDTSSLDGIAVPPDVADFAVAQDGGAIVLRWTRPTAPNLERLEVRRVAWGTGVVVASAPPQDGALRFGWAGSGSVTYVARYLDTFGQWSASDASATLTIEAEDYWPAQGTHDEHGGGYAGTKSGTEVSGGNLQIEAVPATIDAAVGIIIDDATWIIEWPYKTPGTYTTDAQDAGSVVHEKIEVDITPSVTATVPTIDEATATICPDTDGDGNFLDLGTRSAVQKVTIDGDLIDGLGLSIDIDTTPDNPASSPTWDGWRKWVPGAIYRYRGVRLRVTMTLEWYYLFRLTGFTWRRHRLNRKDETTGTTDGSGNYTWTFDTAFTAAPVITATPLEAGAGTTIGVRIISVSASTAVVKTFDTTSGANMTSETVHLHALGV